MEVLSNDEISDIICWLPHGKGFAILKKNKFATQILPLYFKQSKYTSFTRKLKRWGFTRVTAGTELGAYYHKVSSQVGVGWFCFTSNNYSTITSNNPALPLPLSPK